MTGSLVEVLLEKEAQYKMSSKLPLEMDSTGRESKFVHRDDDRAEERPDQISPRCNLPHIAVWALGRLHEGASAAERALVVRPSDRFSIVVPLTFGASKSTQAHVHTRVVLSSVVNLGCGRAHAYKYTSCLTRRQAHTQREECRAADDGRMRG